MNGQVEQQWQSAMWASSQHLQSGQALNCIMRIPALETEDAGDLASRVCASPHKGAVLPHGTLSEVAHPSRSNTAGKGYFCYCEVKHPVPNTLFKIVPKKTKHGSKRKCRCFSRCWNGNLEACMSIHPLKAPLCVSSGTLLLFQGTLRKTLSLPLLKAFLAMGRPISEKIHIGCYTPLPLLTMCNQAQGCHGLKQRAHPHLLQGRGTAPLGKKSTTQDSKQGLEGTYPNIIQHAPLQTPSVVAVGSLTLESLSPLGSIWCGWRGSVTGNLPVLGGRRMNYNRHRIDEALNVVIFVSRAFGRQLIK